MIPKGYFLAFDYATTRGTDLKSIAVGRGTFSTRRKQDGLAGARMPD
jgi:hypothetical protein